MLERATACLKSGAPRESLRYAQRAPRSRRMLHSTFWNHGAGDLDLLPWAALPIPSDLALKGEYASSQRRARHKRQRVDATVSMNVPDGVFLDFLYPPQALAWLQRTSGHQWQRWERRNIRRLPEGFVLASRGYASRARWEETFGNEGESLEEPGDGKDNRIQIHGRAEESLEDVESYSIPGEKSIDGDKSAREEQIASAQQVPSKSFAFDPGSGLDSNTFIVPLSQTADDGQGLGDTTASGTSSIKFNPFGETPLPAASPFADSPADLGETMDLDDEIKPSTNPTQSLRKVMAMGRSGLSAKSAVHTKQALSIYDALDESSKADVRLKKELMEWLSLQPNDMAKSRCVELYDSIPVSDKELKTYSAMLSVLLEQKKLETASKLHEEALENIENGHQISRALFRYAIDHNKWTLAMKTEADHHKKYSESSNTSQLRVFWLHVSDIPQLFSKAMRLAGFFYGRRRRGMMKRIPRTLRFCSMFYKEAISQEFSRDDGVKTLPSLSQRRKFPTRGVQMLFTHIIAIEDNPSKLCGDTIIGMLRPDHGIPYEQLHESITVLYMKYRRMPGVHPPEDFLMLWLERQAEHAAKKERNRREKKKFSITSLVNEWKRLHERLSLKAVKYLMEFYARSGEVESYEKWLSYLRSTYPDYEDQQDILWTRIYIHARRADLDQAQQAFAEINRITAEHGHEPDKICWDMLLHAHSRAGDIEGALTNLQNMIDHAKSQPDEFAFHSVLQIICKSGSVEDVENMLQQYDRVAGQKRNTHLMGSLILAHVHNGDLEAAEAVLRETIAGARLGKLGGSLTTCFNLVLTAHALRRDLDNTMRVYLWMQDEDVPLDGNSYGAIMQVQIVYRRMDEAYRLLKHVMPAKRIEPTGYHYAIVIDGAVKGQLYQMAMQTYHLMVKKNIKPSLSSNAAYLKAKAIYDGRRARAQEPRDDNLILQDTIKELRRIIAMGEGTEIASNQLQPSVGLTLSLPDANPAAYFDHLIYIHGQRRCFEAVQQLYQEYRKSKVARGQSDNPTPMRLFEALMASCWRTGHHAEANECWKLAKGQANETTPPVPVPHLKQRRIGAEDELDALDLHPPETNTDPQQTTLLEKQSPRPLRPGSGQRYMLNRVLRFYLLSLHAQRRTADAINTVIEFLNQGYTMDNMTWNTFIRTLCRTTPPMALLAFVLSERFLTPNFPGWSRTIEYRPNPAAVAEGLPYIRARYLKRGELMPQFKTMVWLAKAMLEIRQLDALGGKSVAHDLPPQLEKYVGTLKQLRRLAPKTLFAVQSMPRVKDRFQMRVLEREGY